MTLTTDNKIIFTNRARTGLAIAGTTALLAKAVASLATREASQLMGIPQQLATSALYQRIIRTASATSTHAGHVAAIFGITLALARCAPQLLFQERNLLEEMVPDHWGEIISFLPPLTREQLLQAYPNVEPVQTLAGTGTNIINELIKQKEGAMIGVLGLALLAKITGQKHLMVPAAISAAMSLCLTHVFKKDSTRSPKEIKQALWISLFRGAGACLLTNFIDLSLKKTVAPGPVYDIANLHLWLAYLGLWVDGALHALDLG